MVTRWERGGVLGENGEGSYKNSLRDVKHNIGKTGNDMVIALMNGVRWVLDLFGRSLHKVYQCLITMLCTRN